MLRLTTFGGVSLFQEGVPHAGPGSQRRRLALLLLIAASGNRGISRDKILGYLWPESEPEAARHALHQSLHALRRSLAADHLFLGTTSLQLNPDVISSDATEFEEAVAGHYYERAVGLYTGPFADGFFLDDAPEFERWVEAERARLAREYAAALERLADASAAAGDHAAAVLWRRRLAAAEPLSTRAATALIEALAAAGDQAGALQFALVHEALVRQELDLPPEPVIMDWVARLRARQTPAMHTVPRSQRGRKPTEPRRRSASTTTPLEGRDRGEQLVRVLEERYTIERRIAEGRVITTYAARSRGDVRAVQLNVIDPRIGRFANVDHFLEVFDQIAGLADPHVVPVYDYGVTNDTLFYATAPQEGLSLKERLQRERQLPLRTALRVAHDTAAALAHAHERNVLHGDLRPKHIILTPDRAVLTSFGLVEALSTPMDSPSSATAVTIGAPAYLSPEQLSGEGRPDARSDLYSLGCVLYEMLVGEPPFGGRSHFSVLGRKLTQPPPDLRALRESVPEALDCVVRRCLARLPADRYATAVELSDELGRLREVL